MATTMTKEQIKHFIARRVARELSNGDFVNLGIGLPTLVPAYLPDDIEVILEAEDGIVGVGSAPAEQEAR